MKFFLLLEHEFHDVANIIYEENRALRFLVFLFLRESYALKKLIFANIDIAVYILYHQVNRDGQI